MNSRPNGSFHSLSDEDKAGIRDLLSQGISLHQASIRLGCNYAHTRNFAHSQSFINYRPHTTDPQLVDAGLKLVRSELTVNAAAVAVGLNDDVLRTRAQKAGLVKPVSRYQRTVNSTNLRVNYLELRLANMSKKDAAVATGIDYRKALYFEKGQEGRGTNHARRLSFVPAGPAAKAYNKLMNRLLHATGGNDPARRPEPKLPPGVNPYTQIHPRYLSHAERVMIADLYRGDTAYEKLPADWNVRILLSAASYAATTAPRGLIAQKMPNQKPPHAERAHK